MKLDGRRALITGGNSGIGLATAQLFVKQGARVAITGRNRDTLDAALTLLGNGARAYQADFTEAHARKRCFESLAVDLASSMLFLLTQESLAERLQGAPTKPSSKTSSGQTF